MELVRIHVLGSVAAAQADIDESGGDVGCCCGGGDVDSSCGVDVIVVVQGK